MKGRLWCIRLVLNVCSCQLCGKALTIVFVVFRFRVRGSTFLWGGHVAAVSSQAAHGSNGRSTNAVY